MKKLRKPTVTNVENNMSVQKFEKKALKKLLKRKKLKLFIMKGKSTKKIMSGWRKLLSSVLNCWNVKFVRSNMGRRSKLKIA